MTFQVLAFLVLFIVLALVERPVRRKERWKANFGLTAINILILGALPVSFFSAAAWARERHIGVLNQFALPFALVLVLNLLARAFISFFTHLLMHKVPLFWTVHRVHHYDTELDVSTTVRFHPLEFVLGLLPGLPLVVLLGLSPWVLMLYETLDAIVNVFSHANVRLPRAVERLLRYVIVTPDLHRIHHSSHQPETDSNYGAVFPLWDIVFRTFRTEPQPRQLGLEDVRDARVDRLGWLLASPFRLPVPWGRAVIRR